MTNIEIKITNTYYFLLKGIMSYRYVSTGGNMS